MEKNKELKFALCISNTNTNKRIELKNSEKVFNFSLSDESFDELNQFIDYLLENIEKYEALIISIESDGNFSDLDSELAKKFKEIWEREFEEIKKEINKVKI